METWLSDENSEMTGVCITAEALRLENKLKDIIKFWGKMMKLKKKKKPGHWCDINVIVEEWDKQKCL